METDSKNQLLKCDGNGEKNVSEDFNEKEER
jgi:hypothetical protein